MNDVVILSLGGSLLCPPSGPETKVIKRYAQWLKKLAKQYRYVVAFTGGGQIARQYITLARQMHTNVSAVDQDWVGIRASRLNAELLRVACGELADPEIITDPRIKLRSQKRILIGAGWKPGRSTDYDAVRLAVENAVPIVYNLSNIKYLYNRDPIKYPDAKPVKQLTWPDYFAITGRHWRPGLNTPFDPVAAKLAYQEKIVVHILHGAYLANVDRALAGQPFVGTMLSTR